MQPSNGNSAINNKQKQLLKQQYRQPESRSLQRENKIKSQRDPKPKNERFFEQDEIYEQPSKVIRNSSSQYDSLLQKLYQKQQQYTMDTKSHQQQHKVYRQAKQQITYLKNGNEKYSAYCIANKESNSGMFSHQRFFVIDSINKQLRYYSHIPKLPLLTLQEIQQTAKEVLLIQRAQRFQLICSKRGIGEIEIKWVEIGEIKEWKLKMGNNAMAKEFAALVEFIRTGKNPNEERQKSSSQLKTSLISPKSNNKPLASGFKKSVISSQKIAKKRQSGVKFADLLLQSMLNPLSIEEQTMKKQMKQKPSENEHAFVIKDSTSQNKKKKQEQNQKNNKNQKEKQIKQLIEVSSARQKSNSKILKDQQIQVTFKNIPQPNEGKDQKNKGQSSQTKNQKQQGVKNVFLQVQKNVDLLGNKNHSTKSIQLQEIINNATIQHESKTNVRPHQRKIINQQYASTVPKPTIVDDTKLYSSVKPPNQRPKYETPSKNNNILYDFHHLSFSKPLNSEMQEPQTHRLSALQKIVLRRKQFQDDRHSYSPLTDFSIKQEMGMSKRIIKNIPNTPTKTIKPSPSNKSSRGKEQPPNQKFYSSTRQQQIYHRQHLLQQRKYAQTLKDPNSQKKPQPKIINQHSHPRKQRSRSKSLTSNIDHYLSTKSKPEMEWMNSWICAENKNEKCRVYRQFVDKCLQNVKSMFKNMDNWHLFHKAGQEYVIKKDQVQFRYSMLAQNSEESLVSQNKEEQQMDELCYLWNIINQNQKQNKQMQICLPLACKIAFQGISIFCRLDLDAVSAAKHLITDLTVIEHTITNLYRWCRIRIKNGQLYQIKIEKLRYIYINHAEARPVIKQEPIYYLNENYVHSYVGGIISTEVHLEQISNHIKQTIIPDLLAYLNKFQPLSCLELSSAIHKFGFDLSILPLAFKASVDELYKKANRIITSEICADAMADSIRRDIHKFYLRKQLNKNIGEQIYKFIVNTLRLDSEAICFIIWTKNRISITLNQLKQKIIDSYVLSSLFIKLGLKCTIKEEFKEQYFQNINCLFWKQFQFNQQNIQLSFLPNVQNYNAKFLNQQYNYFQTIFSKKSHQSLKKQQYNKAKFIKRLGLSVGKEYYQSNYFNLLTVIQKQKINKFVSKLQTLSNQCNSLSWPQQQNTPYFHMNNYSTCYFYCYQSFEQILKGLYDLIITKKYLIFKQLFASQLFRGWVWASHNPLILIALQEIKSLFHKVNNHHNLSLESCLLSLQIAIKFYYEGAISSEMVLQKSNRAALLHVKYGYLQRAVELFATCQKLFQKIVQSQTTNAQLVIQKYLQIYTSKAQILAQNGKYRQAQLQLQQNLNNFFKWKEQFQSQSPQILNLIFKEQFRHYQQLFRVKELEGKYIELIMVIQECSNKYIETELQILSQHNLPSNINEMTAFSKHYFIEILKNLWIAIVNNTNSAQRTPNNQQHMNLYYLPLRNIDLEVIKNIILQIKKQRPHLSPIKQEHFNYFLQLITRKMQSFKTSQSDSFKNKPKSLLVVSIIDCLSNLCQLDKHKIDQLSSNYNEIELLQTLQKTINILGYQYSIGIIDSIISPVHIQL